MEKEWIIGGMIIVEITPSFYWESTSMIIIGSQWKSFGIIGEKELIIIVACTKSASHP